MPSRTSHRAEPAGESVGRTPALLACLVLACVACAGEARHPAGPPDDSPNLALFDPPPHVADGESVTLEIMATDDVGLDRVTIFWGEVGSALEDLPVAGDSATWTTSHLYPGPGFYTIRVQATDTSDQVVTRVWGVTVDPNGGAIAVLTRTFGGASGVGSYNLYIDDRSVGALLHQDSVLVPHVEIGPRQVFLGDVAVDCEVLSNPRKVNVVLADTAVVEFDIFCP